MRRDNGYPVRRVVARPDADLDASSWPATLPAVGHLLRDGLDLGPLTVRVGSARRGEGGIGPPLTQPHIWGRGGG